MALVQMSVWMYLLFAAVGIFGTLFVLLKPKKQVMSRAMKLGLFLFAFDFIIENAGLLLGYWHTCGSVLQLMAVPLEVALIAFLAGCAYALLFPPKFDWSLGAASSLLIAVVGTGIEAIIVGQGVLVYTGGWTSYHTLAAYFAAFLLMHKANSALR